MSATTAQIARLRRLINQPKATLYLDDELAEYIERYPLLDERGEEPYTWDTSTTPPTQDDNEDWIATYDLHAAAADIYEEMAAQVVAEFDPLFDKQKDPRYERYLALAKFHRSRRSATAITLQVSPKETATNVVNLLKKDEEWP